MRTLVAVVLLIVGLGLSGCRKKAAREFYDLESRATILVARDGDDGLLSDEMTGIIAALQAISPDAVEGPKAHELWSKLESDRQRIMRARAAGAAAGAGSAARAPAPQPIDVARPPEPKAEAPEAPDAGWPGRPWANMTLAEFQEHFGACMDGVGEKEVPGRGRMQAWEVIKTPTCTVKYGIPNEDTHHLFLFQNGRLAGERTEQRTTTIIDAGRAPALAQPETPPMPYVMGMPIPGAEAPDAQ